MPWRTTRWCGLVHGSAPLCPAYGSGASCAWYATCFTAVVRSSLTIARASHPSCSTQRTHLPKDWPRGCSPCSGLSILPLLWAKFKYLTVPTSAWIIYHCSLLGRGVLHDVTEQSSSLAPSFA